MDKYYVQEYGWANGDFSSHSQDVMCEKNSNPVMASYQALTLVDESPITDCTSVEVRDSSGHFMLAANGFCFTCIKKGMKLYACEKCSHETCYFKLKK